MSALSVPPSQKTSLSIEQESIHNYANTLSPLALAGLDHYSVVAFCTEVEVRASEAGEGMMGSTEVQLQTDCYEEEIVSDNAAGEEAASVQDLQTSETAGVAKALETLAKTFALRKDSLGPDVPAGSEPKERQTNEKLETGKETEALQSFQPEATEANTDPCTEQNCESVAAKETPNVLRPQFTSLPKCQEVWKITRAARESGEESKTYCYSLFTSNVKVSLFKLI